MEYPKRKQVRLKDYDYSQNGAYFVTICTKDRKSILSEIVGNGLCAVPIIQLSQIGIEVEKSIKYIHTDVNNIISVDNYVIMPNHIHMLMTMSSGGHGNPPLQDVIGYFKSYTTKRHNEINNTVNISLWQRSFYEHIVRNEQDYLEIWDYIDTNAFKWDKDKYYDIS